MDGMSESAISTTNSRLKRRLAYGAAGFVGFVIIVAAWFEFVHDRVFPKRFGVVESGEIYRSGQIHPALIDDVLRDYSIGKVVDLQYWENKPGHLAERAAIESLGLEASRFPLNGNGTGDIEHYALAIREIHRSVQAGQPVLVHCAAGAQRTGGVIAAYRTLVQDRPVASAIAEMEQYDWDPEDDRVLLEYLDDNVDTLARRLVELGVLDRVPASLPVFQ